MLPVARTVHTSLTRTSTTCFSCGTSRWIPTRLVQTRHPTRWRAMMGSRSLLAAVERPALGHSFKLLTPTPVTRSIGATWATVLERGAPALTSQRAELGAPLRRGYINAFLALPGLTNALETLMVFLMQRAVHCVTFRATVSLETTCRRRFPRACLGAFAVPVAPQRARQQWSRSPQALSISAPLLLAAS